MGGFVIALLLVLGSIWLGMMGIDEYFEKRDREREAVKVEAIRTEKLTQRLENCFDERGKFICCECDCK